MQVAEHYTEQAQSGLSLNELAHEEGVFFETLEKFQSTQGAVNKIPLPLRFVLAFGLPIGVGFGLYMFFWWSLVASVIVGVISMIAMLAWMLGNDGSATPGTAAWEAERRIDLLTNYIQKAMMDAMRSADEAFRLQKIDEIQFYQKQRWEEFGVYQTIGDAPGVGYIQIRTYPS